MENQEIYRKILDELWLNSRIQNNELKKMVPRSAQTISKMKYRLWKKRIIHSPTILINPNTIDLHTFFMEIKTNPSEPRILSTITELPQVTAVDGILGPYSLFVKFIVANTTSFASILNHVDKKFAEGSRFHSYQIIEALNTYKLGGFPLHAVKQNLQLSEKDIKILKILEKNHNPRKWPEDCLKKRLISPKEEEFLLKLNLSREISQFYENQIIQHFTISFHKYTGKLGLKFYVRIHPENIGDYHTLAMELMLNPNIVELYRTGEEAGLLAVVRTQSLQDFNQFIQALYQHYPISDTHTTVVVEEKIPSVYPPSLKASQRAISQFKAKKNLDSS